MKKIVFTVLVGLSIAGAVYAGPFRIFNRASNCASGNCAVPVTTVQKTPVLVAQPAPTPKVEVVPSLLGDVTPAKVDNDCLVEKKSEKIVKTVVVQPKVAYNNNMRTAKQFRNNRPLLNRTGRFLSRLRFWR